MSLYTLFKAFWFLFPFIKEIFLGKDKGDVPETQSKIAAFLAKYTWFRKAIIAVGCVSVLLNVYLFNRLIALSREHVELTRRPPAIHAPVPASAPPHPPKLPPDKNKPNPAPPLGPPPAKPELHPVIADRPPRKPREPSPTHHTDHPHGQDDSLQRLQRLNTLG